MEVLKQSTNDPPKVIETSISNLFDIQLKQIISNESVLIVH